MKRRPYLDIRLTPSQELKREKWKQFREGVMCLAVIIAFLALAGCVIYFSIVNLFELALEVISDVSGAWQDGKSGK